MSVIEVGAGLAAGSASLQADALDFKGDAANYGITFSLLAWPYAIEHRLRWLRVQPWELLASQFRE
jgi:Co/Zn/Cd efflux system component